jgi:beta-glucosidase
MGPLPVARAIQNVVNAHIGAYEIIHKLDPTAKVSLPEYNCLIPMADGGVNFMPGQLLSLFLDKARGWDGKPRVKYLDFVAVHYYGSVDTKQAVTFPVEPYHWGVMPAYFRQVLESYYDTFHLPILVAENGFATDNLKPRDDGWTRESYMVAHIKTLMEVKREGIPIMGYMYWTLTDNYEWGSFNPRFGLWSVNCRSGDLTRHETPSAALYREIIRHGGVTPEMEKRFPPPPPLQGTSPNQGREKVHSWL